MNIVMLSDFESRGGAAIAASRQANALAQTEHRLTRLVHTADGLPHAWHTQSLVNSKIDRILYRLIPQIATRESLRRALFVLKPDVINIHNLHSANWSPDLIRVCAEFAPLVWTLHDMWSFTGRCAYNDDCRKFLIGCDAACPTPHEYPPLARTLISRAWEARRKLLADLPALIAVAPSQWLAREARAGLWKDHRVEVIPNGLPLDKFQPVDRNTARHELNIAVEGTALLISAAQLQNRHKGFHIFLEALSHIDSRPLTVITLGAGVLPLLDSSIHLIPLGYLADEHSKAFAYSAADFLIHPAINDNLPNVVLESLACGTPVVALPIGGLPELVRPEQTGYLAETASPLAFAAAITRAIQDRQRGVDLRVRCRAVAESDYADQQQAQRYLELFRQL